MLVIIFLSNKDVKRNLCSLFRWIELFYKIIKALQQTFFLTLKVACLQVTAFVPPQNPIMVLFHLDLNKQFEQTANVIFLSVGHH